MKIEVYFDFRSFHRQFLLKVTQWVRSSGCEMVYWIGMSDVKSEGTFRWESGHALTSDLSKQWCHGEPNNKQQGLSGFSTEFEPG